MYKRFMSLKNMLPPNTDSLIINAYLDLAKSIIMAKRFPFGTDLTDVEPMYHGLQVQIALELFNKQGAEGEIAHNENGISRTYENANVSSSLLKEIVPMCGVPK